MEWTTPKICMAIAVALTLIACFVGRSYKSSTLVVKDYDGQGNDLTIEETTLH